MKIVNTGNLYRIYSDDLKTYEQLPANTYLVNFSQMSGFYLELYPNISVTEKIYGVHEEKVSKILNSFSLFERNLGVILSGDKGIGKSICAKLLSQRSVEAGYPTIIVNTYVPGIADYLTSITQEVVILFDEFDKTFGAKEDSRPQEEMLTLFDGLSQGKKMFVITCNEIHRLNEFLVNRPGRFHYHLRFDYPTPEEITEYLQDKLPEVAYPEISKVVDFSAKVKINYDCLRAIAFELSRGDTFENAIKDLNIVNVDREYYKITAYFADGSKTGSRDDCVDLFANEARETWLRYNRNFSIDITYNPADAKYSDKLFCSVIMGTDVTIDWDYDGDSVSKEEVAAMENKKLAYITLEKKYDKPLHYLV